VPSLSNPIIGRYDSLAALFAARRATPVPLPGGFVRVHPALLLDRSLPDYIALRTRLEGSGVRLVITPAVGPGRVELRAAGTRACDQRGVEPEAR
jgi:hypothetical protein